MFKKESCISFIRYLFQLITFGVTGGHRGWSKSLLLLGKKQSVMLNSSNENKLKNPGWTCFVKDMLYRFEFLQQVVRTHPPDCHKDPSIGVNHEKQGQHQTEDEKTEYIWDAGRWAKVPLHRACCSWSLGPIAAPTQERREGPEEGIKPGPTHTEPSFLEVRDVNAGRMQHGGVTLVREDRKGHQGHNSFESMKRQEKQDFTSDHSLNRARIPLVMFKSFISRDWMGPIFWSRPAFC